MDRPMGVMPSFGDPEDTEGLSATAGEEIDLGSTPVASRETVIESLRSVYDPEIPVNIYDLGLIYALDIGDDGNVNVEMTLTAPGCPVAEEMPQMVAESVAATSGVGRVNVTLTWEPQWTPERMSEDAKLALGMM